MLAVRFTQTLKICRLLIKAREELLLYFRKGVAVHANKMRAESFGKYFSDTADKELALFFVQGRQRSPVWLWLVEKSKK